MKYVFLLFTKNLHKYVIFKEHKYDVLDNVDALVLMTEWKEFRSTDCKLLNTKMKRKIIFDGRNQYDKFHMKSLGFEYHQIGVENL